LRALDDVRNESQERCIRDRGNSTEPAMKEWLIFASEQAIVIFNAMALVVIVVGTIEAFFSGLGLMLTSRESHERSDVWLRFGRWLVAGLTFQLAADIIETSITTDWNAIGRIAAIAVIRTFLNVFLERDLAEVRMRKREEAKERSPTSAERR
jgi:uncharacterized membrane protein